MATLVGNRYRLVHELGSGGMGRVFQAVDTNTGEAVAAKLLTVSSEDNLEILLRFQQEGTVLSTLKHPNIVQVYCTFLEENTSCIIMELLEGRSLAQILRDERLPLSRVKLLMRQVASALAYAHGRAIVHRDIKPGNIMVIGNDRVKVTDFGIARVLRTGATLQTATGAGIGTPLYMAPEQIEGQKVDGRADVYSFGAVMYHMVTGRPPFEGDDPLTIAFKHVHNAPVPPSAENADVPADWEALILTTLAKNPAERYQSAHALEEAVSMLTIGGDGAPRTISGSGVRQVATTRSRMVGQRTQPEVDQASSQAKTERGKTTVGFRAAVIAATVVVLLTAAGLALKLSASSTRSTFAKTLVAQWGGRGTGAGQFKIPESVAVDAQGNIYVADYGNNRIQKLSPAGTVVAMWGTPQPGRSPGQFDGPSGVAVDSHGNVYVADSGNNRVQELSRVGRPISQWGRAGSKPGQFSGPHSLAVDASGNVYVADFGNDRVQRLSSAGKVVVMWGTRGSGPGQFNGPVGIAVDDKRNVYVADYFNNRVQKLSPGGTFVAQFAQWGRTGTGFARPHGVAVDAHGDIYVSDFANNVIQVVSQAGNPIAELEAPVPGHGHFNRPSGMAVDASGDLYVADSGNNRIEKFAPR